MQKTTFYFQNLEIYKLGKRIVVETYKLTDNFPPKEKFCLINQMNRAAVSVPSNIAEGVARNTGKDKVHFLNIAFASLMELFSQTEVSKDLGYISEDQLNEFTSKVKTCAIKICNYVQFAARGSDQRSRGNCE
ncbi:MAG: four helix bundle protein [Synergistaceae bacterium]|nr:four helix bundle protein [Synergistaceae bacterium]